MNVKPLCMIKDCKNNCVQRNYKSGLIGYRKLCSHHYRLIHATPVEKTCLYCNNKFNTREPRKRNYCSRSCASFVKGKVRMILKKKIGHCECCLNNNMQCLAMHHLIERKKRDRKQKTERVVLCHNCHNTLHGIIGYMDFNFHTKEETLDVIRKYLSALNPPQYVQLLNIQ